jgi:FdhD protein
MSVRSDSIVGEEPLEIRVVAAHQDPVAVGVTMRTPGHDFELAVGFLLSEGVIERPDDVRSIRYCTDLLDETQRYNVVTVWVAPRGPIVARRSNLNVSSSCGICGTTTIEQLSCRCPQLTSDASIGSELLTTLPELLKGGQKIFEKTGGLHAAGLFDTRSNRMIAVREDVGRHNAVDKLVGWAMLRKSLPLDSCVLVVSGRVSFEIVQKSALAGIPILVAVSAPSSLAVTTAKKLGMTLVAFVRGDRANIYSWPERIEDDYRPDVNAQVADQVHVGPIDEGKAR